MKNTWSEYRSLGAIPDRLISFSVIFSICNFSFFLVLNKMGLIIKIYKYRLFFLAIVSCRDFKNADHTAAEVKDEISFHFKMKSILELTLPKDIVIGPFRVNIQPLRQFLIQKRQNCCTQLLVMFTESLRARIDVVLSDYMQIRTRLKATSRDIEHLFEEQEWMESIPLTVKALDKIIQKLKHEYDVLDHFWWNLSDQDFEAKWQAIGFPRQIQLHVSIITIASYRNIQTPQCMTNQNIIKNNQIC